jgi:hypothetical protein
MNCNEFDLNVLALARGELIDATRREISLEHTENCFRCANLLAGERALFDGVRAVVAELAEERAPAYVGAALLAAFREQTAAATGDSVVPIAREVPWYWRLEAAAAILILVSVFASFWFYSRSPVEKHVALTAPPAPVIAGEPASPAVKFDSQIVSDPGAARPTRTRHRAARSNTNATEDVTEFFPLMDGIDVDSLEAVQAVRVELPASALLELGYRGGPDVPAGPVRADVLLGYDGLPRAIRFVR